MVAARAWPSTLVCVTGMHRSGTSVAAGLLASLGVDFGPDEGMLEPADENPHGFWEQRVVADLNDDVLAALGGSWYEPPILADGWAATPTLDGMRDRIDGVLGGLFGARAAAGLKDPRMSLLLPLWRTRSPRVASILLVRDPREVAQSLARRNGIHSERSAYLWLRYVAAAWRNDPAHLLVHYAQLFDELDTTLDRVCTFLSLDPPSRDARITVADIVDPSARRSRADDETGPMMRRAVALHERIRAGDGATDEIERLQRGWLRRAGVERFLARSRRRARGGRAPAAPGEARGARSHPLPDRRPGGRRQTRWE